MGASREELVNAGVGSRADAAKRGIYAAPASADRASSSSAGKDKPFRTTLSELDYKAVRTLAAEYRDTEAGHREAS